MNNFFCQECKISIYYFICQSHFKLNMLCTLFGKLGLTH